MFLSGAVLEIMSSYMTLRTSSDIYLDDKFCPDMFVIIINVHNIYKSF